MPLSSTKFRRPPLASDHVARPDLISRLDRGRDRPLTLVCSPAGYGKSTLLSAWLQDPASSGAWLSLEPRDDSLRALVSGVVETIEASTRQLLSRTRSWLDGELPSAGALVTCLVDELSEVAAGPMVLVLDDYHVIHDSDAQEAVSLLVDLAPAGFHLALATRVDPPLPLTSLRASGKITEIRQRDLRFSEDEAGRFLQAALGRAVDPEIVQALEQKTEGWGVGIRLAALSLRHVRDPVTLLERLPSGSRFVTDYLVSEVLDQQMPIVQEYLLRASLLTRFCAELCDALVEADLAGDRPVGIFDGAGFLALAERANVFLTPLDDEGRWYRFHHLFRELLRHQLETRRSEKEIATLHRSASKWLEANGFLTDAIEQVIVSEPSLAVELVARHRHELMNREEWSRLDQWLRLLRRQHIEGEADLLLLTAWTMENRHRYNEVFELARQAEDLLQQESSDEAASLRGEVQTIRALESYVHLDGQKAIQSAEDALRLLDSTAESVRGYAVILLSMAWQMVGDLEAARRVVREYMRTHADLQGTYDARLLAALTVVDWIAGDLGRMSVDAAEYLRAGREAKLEETLGMGNYFLGVAAYERNQLETAEDHLGRIVRGLPAGDPWNLANSGFVLAVTLNGRGRREEANRLAADLSSRALEVRHPGLLPLTRAFEADLALRQGRTSAAIRWADDTAPGPVSPPYRWFNPRLTYVKARVAQGTPEARAEAAAQLDELRATYGSIHAVRALIEVLALEALLQDSSGNRSSALETLSEALRLAEPGGFVRLFVDLGRPMRDLLRRIGPESGTLGLVRRLLAAFAEESLGISGEILVSDTTPQLEGGRLLATEITNRELEVLSLLAERLSNKEIAAQLQIGTGTVTTHTSSLYRKLEVSGRREAVAKAEALGILPHR